MPYTGLAEDFVSGTVSSAGRKVWTLAPEADSPARAVIFLDAELYIERVQAPGVVRQLEAAGRIPRTLCVFVSNANAASRHADFTCNEAYAAYIADGILPWLLRDHAQVSQVVIAGLSLSGLAAAFTALRFPSRFAAVICQSPSFWWERERFRQLLPAATSPAAAFWVSVGDLETEQDVTHPPSGLIQQSSQVEACQRTCEALRNAGYRVSDRNFSGGHDPKCWREDLALALPWTLGGP